MVFTDAINRLLARFSASRIERVNGTEHIPRTGPALFVANHISYFDPIVLFAFLLRYTGRKPHFMALRYHWWFPGANQLAKWTGTAFIRLGRRSEVLDHLRSNLEHGELCVVYPEGTRTTTSELNRGKTGAARLALWTRVPVIPVGITGPATRSTFGAWMNFILGRKFSMTFGPAISLEAYSSKEITKDLLEATTRTIMQSIGALCGKTYPY